jgi:hypothetical protein
VNAIFLLFTFFNIVVKEMLEIKMVGKGGEPALI